MDEFDKALMIISNETELYEEKLTSQSDLIFFNQMQNYSSGLEILQDDEYLMNNLHNSLLCALTVRKRIKSLDEKRKELLKPIQEKQKKINNEFKKYKEFSDQIQELIKEKITQDFVDINKLDCDLGSFTKKNDFYYTLKDLKKVPVEYLKIDEEKVQQDIKSGIRNIPGLLIEEKNNYNFRLK